jgi:protein-S-isoprenylcysteine O-methyltransferase Ste14
MDDNDKIPILMAEYSTLRAAMLAARSNVAQAIRITFATLMGVVGFSFSTGIKGPSWVPWAIAAIALGYFAFTFLWNKKYARNFTRRIRAIEKDVNDRAGERLLMGD